MSVARLLELTDLDELAGAVAELPADLPASDADVVRDALADWDRTQAVANLLMYPQLIAPELRGPALLRGLADDRPYLRLAAAVGVGQLWGDQRHSVDRPAVVAALLGLVEQDAGADAGVIAKRAALSVGTVLRPDDGAAVLTVLLRHRSPVVRRNLEAALLGALDTDDVADLLEDGSVPAELAATAPEVLGGDGIDLDLPGDEQRRMPLLAAVPSLSEWDG